ncbi:MAG TPA: C39 family peptidase [Chloroflexota bacterium]|nr:C39 family peptidase [Chloroflexota bacterium]
MGVWVVLLLALFGDIGAADVHVLDVPYRSQLDGSGYALANCGPASLSMALAFYGIDASPWDLRVKSMKAQHSWVGDDGGYSDRYGVFVYNLASAAETTDVHASGLWTREGGRVDRLHEWQPTEIRREVQADHPVIVQVGYRALPKHAGSTTLDDHFIVIHGLRGTDFVYSDPLGVGDAGPAETISETDLVGAMGRSSAPRVGFAVVGARGRPS